jgi:RNA polymerase sigma factor (sigma-70 family)
MKMTATLADLAATRQLDPLLLPLLDSPEAELQETLGDLITLHARPVIRGVLRGWSGSGGPESSDVEGEVILLLLDRLRRLRHAGPEQAIYDFLGYVAVVTYNVLSRHLRKRGAQQPRGRDGRQDPFLQVADPAPDPASAFERRTDLFRLWEEIRQLPPRQAAALLLNLRDEQRRNAVALLPLTGVATMRDIARAIAMPVERFAEIWSRLPLDDAAIAQILDVTRQQVINLRKSARERLARRMRVP